MTPGKRERLLRRVREVIDECEQVIALSEKAMLHGLGPFDIEGTRVRLAELRKWERLLRSPWVVFRFSKYKVARG